MSIYGEHEHRSKCVLRAMTLKFLTFNETRDFEKRRKIFAKRKIITRSISLTRHLIFLYLLHARCTSSVFAQNFRLFFIFFSRFPLHGCVCAGYYYYYIFFSFRIQFKTLRNDEGRTRNYYFSFVCSLLRCLCSLVSSLSQFFGVLRYICHAQMWLLALGSVIIFRSKWRHYFLATLKLNKRA